MTNPVRRRMAAAVAFLGLLTVPAAASVAGAAAAAAKDDDYVGRTPPTLPPDTIAPRVLGQVETRGGAAGAGSGTGDPIPITGGDVAGLTALGLAAVATGTVLLRRGRRAPG